MITLPELKLEDDSTKAWGWQKMKDYRTLYASSKLIIPLIALTIAEAFIDMKPELARYDWNSCIDAHLYTNCFR